MNAPLGERKIGHITPGKLLRPMRTPADARLGIKDFQGHRCWPEGRVDYAAFGTYTSREVLLCLDVEVNRELPDIAPLAGDRRPST